MRKLIILFIILFTIPLFAQNYSANPDGSVRAVLAIPFEPDSLSSFTIEWWAKREHNDVTQYFMQRPLGESNPRSFLPLNTYNGFYYVGVSGWGTIGVTGIMGDSAVADINTWVHNALVFDSTASNIYVYQGGITGDDTLANSYLGKTIKTWIGVFFSTNGATAFYDGLVDEMRMWTTARTLAEINVNKLKELTGSETGLQYYWKFNSTVTSSATANTLTLTGTMKYSTDAPFVLDTTKYYIDADKGNDANGGQDIVDALASFDSINTAGITLEAGDIVYLRTDDTWREQLTVPSSGSAGLPITFTKYDSTGESGADPVISGADLVTGWVSVPTAWATGGTWVINSNAAEGSSNIAARNILSAADLSGSGNQIRITLTAHPTSNSLVDGTSIGQRSGSTEDMVNTPVRITWDDGSNSTTITAGETKVSDAINFTYDSDVTHLQHIHFQDTHQYYLGQSSPGRYYDNTAASDATMVQDWDDHNISGYLMMISKLEYRTAANGKYYSLGISTEPKQIFINGTRAIFASNSANVGADSTAFWTTSGDDTLFVYGDTTNVEASAYTYNIDCRKDYITITDLKLEKANEDGILLKYGDNIIIEDVEIKDARRLGIYVGVADDVTLTRLTIHNTGESHGIYLDGAEVAGTDNPIVQNCLIYDNKKTGIVINGDNVYQVQNPIIRFNKIYNNDNYGLTSQSSDGGLYHHNLIYGNTLDAMRLSYDLVDDSDHSVPAENDSVYNNVIYTNAGGIFVNNYSTGHVIKNNIVYRYANANFLIGVAANGNATIDYNCYYGSDLTDAFQYHGTDYSTLADWQTASSQDANSISSDPLFADAASNDFTLQSGSPAINAGVSVGLVLDYAGNTVPFEVLPDIGAYEYQLSTSTGYQVRFKCFPDFPKFKRH